MIFKVLVIVLNLFFFENGDSQIAGKWVVTKRSPVKEQKIKKLLLNM